jgi:GMP synthase-like glutamine amidotransferase
MSQRSLRSLRGDASTCHTLASIYLERGEYEAVALNAGVLVASVFGGEIVPQPKIGLEKIEIARETPLLGHPREIEGYHLHNSGVTLPLGFDLVAGRPSQIEAFKHAKRPIYGIIFHPEVRNRWVVERFVDLG